MAKLSTKNLSLDVIAVSRMIQPGNRVVKILSLELIKPEFRKEDATDPDPYYIYLTVEGPNLGEEFDGFLFDKNDSSKGKYKGQVGKVRGSYYAFSNTSLKGNKKVKKGTEGSVNIYRDTEILKFLKSLCKEMGMLNWLDSQEEKHETIESYCDQFNLDKPFANKWIRMCIAGKMYKNKNSYTNYNLFLPKHNPIVELESVPEEKSRILKFDEKKHILALDNEIIKTVSSFEEEAPRVLTKKLDSSFDL